MCSGNLGTPYRGVAATKSFHWGRLNQTAEGRRLAKTPASQRRPIAMQTTKNDGLPYGENRRYSFGPM